MHPLKWLARKYLVWKYNRHIILNPPPLLSFNRFVVAVNDFERRLCVWVRTPEEWKQWHEMFRRLMLDAFEQSRRANASWQMIDGAGI